MSETQNSHHSPKYLGETAVRELNEMSIPPFPPYYEVWFSHLEKKNDLLSSEIDNEIDAGKSINELFLKDIHGRYFSSNQPSNDIEHFATQLLNETNSLKRLAEGFDSSSREFRKDLDDASNHAQTAGTSSTDVETLLASLLATAKKAITRNAELEANLATASDKIASLQVAIETIAIDANTDFLTKLRNRRYFDSAIGQLAKASVYETSPLCLIVADIDHFKKFNDTWGHQVGDQVLKLVASVLRDNVKGQDLIARYGGEEFAIALPNTTLEDALTLADNIRIAVSKRKLINKSTNIDLGRITMSFGVSEYQADTSTEQFFYDADAALYMAKQAGRDRVMSAAQQN